MFIYLDTNVFIGAVEGRDDDQVREAIWRLFSFSERHGSVLMTSALSIAELLVKPLQLGLNALVSTYLALLEPGDRNGLAVVPITQEVLIRAAHIRKDDLSIKLPDAIHLATAEREQCNVFLTGDQQLISKLPGLCRALTVETVELLTKTIARK